ncbi:MAG: hypothetical protein AAGA23_08520 [Pseudomonadota bacterium]
MTEQKPVSDFNLLMLYYGEHDDPELATRVAGDPVLRERLAKLEATLKDIEQAPLPEPDPDLGARTWQKIVPQLQQPSAAPVSAAGFWHSLLRPRFSAAGLAALLSVGVIAFVVGRSTGPTPVLDAEAVVAQQISDHLARAELLFTELANSSGDARFQQAAAPLLRANRLYRATPGLEVDPQLRQLLLDMETLLLSLANAAPDEPLDEGLESARQYVDQDLLFRVRSLRRSLSADRPDPV